MMIIYILKILNYDLYVFVLSDFLRTFRRREKKYHKIQLNDDYLILFFI